MRPAGGYSNRQRAGRRGLGPPNPCTLAERAAVGKCGLRAPPSVDCARIRSLTQRLGPLPLSRTLIAPISQSLDVGLLPGIKPGPAPGLRMLGRIPLTVSGLESSIPFIELPPIIFALAHAPSSGAERYRWESRPWWLHHWRLPKRQDYGVNLWQISVHSASINNFDRAYKPT